MSTTDDRSAAPECDYETERVVRSDGRYVIFFRWPDRSAGGPPEDSAARPISGRTDQTRGALEGDREVDPPAEPRS